MFSGSYKSNLDYKRRLYIPADLKGEMDETLFLKRGFDNHLEIHTIGHLFWFRESLVPVQVKGGKKVRITIPKDFWNLKGLRGEGKVILECHGSFIIILPRPNGQEGN